MVKIFREILYVALGGVVGASLRMLLGDLPIAGYQSLLIINLLGAGALGALLARVTSRHSRLFFGTGVLGGFTTTSALAVTSLTDFNNSALIGFLYLLLTFYGGLLVFRLAEKISQHA